MYCVMWASTLSLYNVYQRYDIHHFSRESSSSIGAIPGILPWYAISTIRSLYEAKMHNNIAQSDGIYSILGLQHCPCHPYLQWLLSSQFHQQTHFLPKVYLSLWSTNTHAHTHARTHAHTQAYTHTPTHTNTHTKHTLVPLMPFIPMLPISPDIPIGPTTPCQAIALS